ncbi:MAG: GMP synthase (glutamine-hydrolyzing), partial [Clostridiales bacterium]|nr:GMP synthase (glutamine-hydrolyzing) [Clostridiales bacterium]
MKDQILILDFDHRFSAAIAAKLRAERISARILPGNTSAESIMAEEALGVILSGGT